MASPRVAGCRVAARWAVLAAAVAALFAGGCGGPSALTGGSIPIGLSVQVVHAEDVTQPIPGSDVTLKVDGTQKSGTADAEGNVDLSPAQAGASDITVVPSGAGFTGAGSGWDWNFDIPLGVRIQVIAALWPGTFDPSIVDHVTLAPSSFTFHVGDAIRFVATAYDSAGNVLPVQPSLMLQGDVGTLSSNGRIQATKTGRGLLMCWLKGKTASAEIQVIP